MNGERFKMIRNSYKSFESKNLFSSILTIESKNKKKEENMMREKQRA